MTAKTAPRLTTLDNGLRIVTDEMHEIASASVGIWAGAGSRHEEARVNGVAHLFEHMAFKGTERRTARAIAEEIEAVGGHLNAYTARENTAYFARVLADDLALGVDILTDILENPKLDEDELARERSVVLQEIGMVEDTPDDIIFDHFQATAFPDQPIGRPILGPAEIVAEMPRQAIADYLSRHYVGRSMVVAASGAVDHDRLVDMIGTRMGARTLAADHAVEPATYKGGDFRQEQDLEQAHILIGMEAFGFLDPDYYALQTFSTLFGGGMSSRLFQEVREERGLAYSVYSFVSSYRDSGLFGFYAGTGAEELPELVAVSTDCFAGIADSVTEAELDRARRQLIAGLLMGLESTFARAELAAQQLLGHGRLTSPEEMVAKVEAITLDDIRRVVGRLKQSKPTVAALGPLGHLEEYDRIRGRLS